MNDSYFAEQAHRFEAEERAKRSLVIRSGPSQIDEVRVELRDQKLSVVVAMVRDGEFLAALASFTAALEAGQRTLSQPMNSRISGWKVTVMNGAGEPLVVQRWQAGGGGTENEVRWDFAVSGSRSDAELYRVEVADSQGPIFVGRYSA